MKYCNCKPFLLGARRPKSWEALPSASSVSVEHRSRISIHRNLHIQAIKIAYYNHPTFVWNDDILRIGRVALAAYDLSQPGSSTLSAPFCAMTSLPHCNRNAGSWTDGYTTVMQLSCDIYERAHACVRVRLESRPSANWLSLFQTP